VECSAMGERELEGQSESLPVEELEEDISGRR
jgi:hypothetical protein